MYVFVVVLYKFWFALKSKKMWIVWRMILLRGSFLREHANLEIVWTLTAGFDFVVLCYAFYDVVVFNGRNHFCRVNL